jgi:hypothetical protein
MALIVIAATPAAATLASSTTGASAATTTTAAEAASATAKSSSPAAGAIRLWFRFVNLQSASPEFAAVQCRDGFLSFPSVGHFHERKSAGAASFAVGDQADFFNCTVGLE